MKQHSYYLYITTNPKKTVLYTGVTNDLERRLQEHLDDHLGERKSFAGKNFCYNLVYYEWYQYIQAAIGREKEIKGWLRAKKEKLIATFNPDCCQAPCFRWLMYWGSLRDAAMINAQVNSAGATGEPMPSATATPLSVQALMSM